MSHRQGSADDAMEALHGFIKEHQVSQKFKDKFNSVLSKTPWLHANTPYYVMALDNDVVENLCQTSKADGVLASKVNFRFNPAFDVITGTLSFVIYPVNRLQKIVEASSPLDKPIFKLTLSAAESLPYKHSEIDKNSAIWATNNGFYFKQAFDSILETILIKLDKALKNPNYIIEN